MANAAQAHRSTAPKKDLAFIALCLLLSVATGPAMMNASAAAVKMENKANGGCLAPNEDSCACAPPHSRQAPATATPSALLPLWERRGAARPA